MNDFTEIEKERNRVIKKCQEIKEKLKDFVEDPLAFARIAQEANDLWVEYKRREIEYSNQLVMKRIGDLYGG